MKVVANGTVDKKNGTGSFLTSKGDQVGARREGPRHWTGTNQTDGTTYDFSSQPHNSTWAGSRTGSDGTQTEIGQFTVQQQSDRNGETQVSVFRVDRFDDGWKVPQGSRGLQP